ncbi:MAG: hypothetical protein J2P19_18220 [Pseudonocardia sp.]|nr:hypothetical protein [Pseudonocardia sp.]
MSTTLKRQPMREALVIDQSKIEIESYPRGFAFWHDFFAGNYVEVAEDDNVVTVVADPRRTFHTPVADPNGHDWRRAARMLHTHWERDVSRYFASAGTFQHVPEPPAPPASQDTPPEPPVTIGGVIRAVNTVDLRTDQAGQYVTVDMPVEDVRLLECGCWLIGTTPPGQSRQHPPRVVIQRCDVVHGDGLGPGVLDRQPQVLRCGPS